MHALLLAGSRTGLSRLIAALFIDLLEQAQNCFLDLRFRVHFQATGTGSPGSVTAQGVLIRGRNITFTSIGQLNRKGLLERTLTLDIQPRRGEYLVGNRRDPVSYSHLTLPTILLV